MNAYDRLLLPENLIYSWRKAKNLYRMADGYIDHAEIARFELDLERQLNSIHQQFGNGNYNLAKLRPLPRPKKLDGDRSIDRQYYHVTVQDQVAWIAVANALGPELDQKMPPWSYGNRIYRPAWYDHSENSKSKLEIGPYRHESGHLYRKFQHSWPLFRRHIALTARAMARRLDRDILDQPEKLAIASAEAENLAYLQSNFWTGGAKNRTGTDIYHASIDLKQFFPTTSNDAVLRGLLLATGAGESKIRPLLEKMLQFTLDRSDVPELTMKNVEPPFDTGAVTGIPTGLFVAGFLCNVAMIPIDAEVNAHINSRRSVAHFRFVDDHTMLAYGFDELCEWIQWYETLLSDHKLGPTINAGKIDPLSLGRWLEVLKVADSASVTDDKEHASKKAAAKADTKIDGSNPTKLLTQTLGQVSAIAQANADILDDEDLRERLKLLEWFLLADIPEREIRPDTRAAFAAGQIAKLAPVLVQEGDGLIDAARSFERLKLKANDPKTRVQLREQLRDQSKQLRILQSTHDNKEREHLHHCFSLLLQAFKEYPGKVRLFYRIHQYCQLTGYPGLRGIANLIRDIRKEKKNVWADYYAGLSLQILSGTMLSAARVLTSHTFLQSDKKAAINHLNDVARLNLRVFGLPDGREAWFQSMARWEFGVSAAAVAEVLNETAAHKKLSGLLRGLSLLVIPAPFEMPSAEWRAASGSSAGVWGHRCEQILSIESQPSTVWRERFEPCFDYSEAADRLAVRRYPQILSDRAWSYFVNSRSAMKDTDSGWVSDALESRADRISQATSSPNVAFQLASKAFDSPANEAVTAKTWVGFCKEFSPFDPRRSEWTALEIVRQVVVSAVKVGGGRDLLDRIHPNNILISGSWIKVPAEHVALGWGWWRDRSRSDNPIKSREPESDSIRDYRYTRIQ
jgi:hypothetical protein